MLPAAMQRAFFAANLWYEPRRAPCQGTCVSRSSCQKHVNEVGEVFLHDLWLCRFTSPTLNEMISLDSY